MIRVVLAIAALLTTGLAQRNNKPCPEEPEIKANVTNCINLMSQMKCDGSFVTVKMTGMESGIPCEWNRRQNMCGGRLDCSFEYSNKTECGEMPRNQAPNNNCGFANKGNCEKMFSTGKMTGKTYKYPCMWSMPKDGMGSCMMNAKCGEMMKATPKPTAVPTMVPTGFPTMVPTEFPTTVPTAFPTVVPTAAPTSTPSFSPTSTPTLADICHFSDNDETSCVAFNCHYNHDNGACTLEPFPGSHCLNISGKQKCKKEALCDWISSTKKCRAANYPTPKPTTLQPTPVPQPMGICDLFTSQFDCDSWLTVAGCHWDATTSICLEAHMTKSPTMASPCLGKGKQACKKLTQCQYVNKKCLDVAPPTMKPTVADPCYVDFAYYQLMGTTQTGVDECDAKGMDCEVVVDPFWGHFCQEVVCSSVTNKNDCTAISHCMIQGSGRRWSCVDSNN